MAMKSGNRHLCSKHCCIYGLNIILSNVRGDHWTTELVIIAQFLSNLNQNLLVRGPCVGMKVQTAQASGTGETIEKLETIILMISRWVLHLFQ